MKKILFGLLVLGLLGAVLLSFLLQEKVKSTHSSSSSRTIPSPNPTPLLPPAMYIIPMKKHVFQSFNNCGPATLAMTLSYYGIDKSQEELGNILRPYQVPGGDNDDKSVTLEEVAAESKKYGLTPYLRPNGTIEKMKQFIALGFPVITRTWLHENEDIGHYRVVRGYDESSKQIIQDDSLQAANSRYSYDEFLSLWKPFNYEYLVLIPDGKQQLAQQILGEEYDEKVAWENSRKRIITELANDPNNPLLLFNLSINEYKLGNYQASVEAYEKAEPLLTFRHLWYQIDPILAYYKLKNYDRVFAITDRVLNNHNRAFSELYQLRGKIYRERGQTDLARQEFEKAVFYNSHYEPTQKSLESL